MSQSESTARRHHPERLASNLRSLEYHLILDVKRDAWLFYQKRVHRV
ncbi:hypothetical protein [Legionella moravica]|nr:hypothetical protein [Legionella moravica]